MALKKALSISATALLAATVVGCGANSSGSPSATAKPGTAQETTGSGNADSQQVDLQVWSWFPTDEIWKKAQPEFNAKYPNIHVTYTRNVMGDYKTKLQIAVQAGQAPDVIGLQLGSFVSQYSSVLEPLSPYAEKSMGANWKSQFIPSIIDRAAQFDLKALPTGIVNTPYLAYNVDLFKKAGVTPPSTYAELLDVLQKFKQANLPDVIPRLGFAAGEWDSGIRDLFFNLGNQIAPGKIESADVGKVAFTDPDLVKATDLFKQFFTDNVFQDGTLNTVWNPQLRDMFEQKGQLPMIMVGGWILSDDATNATKFPIALAPFPTVAGGTANVLTDGDGGFGIYKDSKHKDAAWKLIEFLVNGTYQDDILSKMLSFQPVKKGVDMDASLLANPAEKDAVKLVSDMVQKHSGGPRFLVHPELDQALFTNLQKVATNALTPEQAMAEVQKVSDKISR